MSPSLRFFIKNGLCEGHRSTCFLSEGGWRIESNLGPKRLPKLRRSMRCLPHGRRSVFFRVEQNPPFFPPLPLFAFALSPKRTLKDPNSPKGVPKDPNIVFFTCISGDGARAGGQRVVRPFLRADKSHNTNCLVSPQRNKGRKERFLFLFVEVWKWHSTRHAPALTAAAQYAFKISMIHWVVQFALRIAFRSVLHRYTSRGIHRWKSSTFIFSLEAPPKEWGDLFVNFLFLDKIMGVVHHV